MLKKILLAGAMLGMAASASAAVFTLQSITPSGSDYIYSYDASFGPDEGLRTGDSLILFDFAGYVSGSVFGTGDWAGTTQLSSMTPYITPGQTDDPTIPNLVFTYTGPDFQTSGGPYAAYTISGLGAVSTILTTKLDAFTSFTTKNNPAPSSGTQLIQLGVTQVPGLVPEPASWAMMILGFGLVGIATRRRASTLPVSA